MKLPNGRTATVVTLQPVSEWLMAHGISSRDRLRPDQPEDRRIGGCVNQLQLGHRHRGPVGGER